MNGIAWDYEECTTPYYHIYSYNGELDLRMDDFTLEIPETPENTEDIECIVAALERINKRLT